MIYLASPYSDPDYHIRNRRFIGAREFTFQALQDGVALFSPIVYGHQFASDFGAPFDAQSWKFFNDVMINSSTAMWVLKLKNWDTSLGVEDEMRKAALLGIPLEFKEPLPHADF